MKKTLALMTTIFALAASPALAMNVDDILELCRAGFEPDRIARIVEAAGIDQPLEASDWSRIKSEGCGDEVVDALLDVLAPVEVEEEYEGETYDSERDNVNINLYGDWGTNGWYGSAFWGGYSPYWGIGYSAFDPWWEWRWHWTGGYSWYDPWWCYPYRTAYYCHTWYNPYNYCHGNYTGGYYYGGVYERQKASRQGGTAKAYRYASAKTTPSVVKATYASAKAKPYRGGVVATGMTENGGVAVRKSSRTSVTTANGTTYTKTKSSSAVRGSSGTTTGGVKQKGSTTTVRTDNGYSKRKTTVTNGGATSTGNSTTTVNRSKTRTKTSTGTSGSSTTVKRKGSGATSTGKAPATTAPSTGKTSGSTYRAPAPTSAPGGTATPRTSGGGTARTKGGK